MIRPFQPEDAFACCDIIHACLEAETSYPPALLFKIRAAETPQSMTERAAHFYVAVFESEGCILGFIGLDLNEIRLLYVNPASQRRGIGRSLIEHAITMVPGPLFQEIFVYSIPGAFGFYSACGFINKGSCIFDFAGSPLPTVFMALPIPDIRFPVPI